MLIAVVTVGICLGLALRIHRDYQFKSAIHETIENVKNGTDSIDRAQEIVSVLRKSTIKSVKSPVIADALLMDRGKGRSKVIGIDWIGKQANLVSGVGVRFANGDEVEIGADLFYTEGSQLYFHTTFSIQFAFGDGAKTITEVWLIGTESTTTRVLVGDGSR